eukprot:scaffold1504_cov417-Prasinococcus_capsulatus_cf.AAC.14
MARKGRSRACGTTRRSKATRQRRSERRFARLRHPPPGLPAGPLACLGLPPPVVLAGTLPTTTSSPRAQLSSPRRNRRRRAPYPEWDAQDPWPLLHAVRHGS